MNEGRQLGINTRTLILAAILLLTTLAFSNTFQNGFINTWDDHVYLLENPYIRDFSLQGIRSIFTTFHAANYHPVTTLSWAIEYRLFGLNPSVFHITNLVFHLLNTILVFRLILMLTRKTDTSSIVALFFAIHPLHVETVSFLSQRKDVLYAFFYLASLISYVHSMKGNSKLAFFIASLLFFLLSLLSKSMAVTLPVLLLLMDYYSGRRFTWRSGWSKIPFFALALVFGIVAILSQKAYGAIIDLPAFSALERVFLVSYACLFYIFRMFVPFNLSAVHLYPARSAGGMLPLEYYLAPLLILMILWGVFKAGKFKKELVFGLGFYLITISLVLQILPVGSAIVAERYTYVPYIGLFFVVGQFYSATATSAGRPTGRMRPVFLSLLIGYAVLFSVTTWRRNEVWKNSFTLWSDVISKNPSATVAYYNLGVARFNAKDFRGAIDDYSRAIELKPDYAEAYNYRGESKLLLQDDQGALADFDRAIVLKPDNAEAYKNRGDTRNRLKDYEGAVADFTRALSIKPDDGDAYFRRAKSKSRLKDYEGTIGDLSKVIELSPRNAVAYNNRGIARAILGAYMDAMNDFNRAIQLKPDYKEARDNLERVKPHLTPRQ
jgi:tetratricopeptide (TPR) repeat protein